MTQTIPANGMVAFNISGDYYYILSATGNVTVKADTGGVANPHPARTGLENVDPFVRLEVTDVSGAENTVTIIGGIGGRYIDNRIS